MKRKPKVHLMQEFDRTRSHCGAVVPAGRLTDRWQRITCNECISPAQLKRVGAYLTRQGASR